MGVGTVKVKMGSYLSSLPSTPAIRPGPVKATHCSIDKPPQSQGIRMSISARFDIADQHPKANRGALDGPDLEELASRVGSCPTASWVL